MRHLSNDFLARMRDAGLTEDAKVYEVEPTVIRPNSQDVMCPRDGHPGAAYVDAILGKDNAGPGTYMLSYTWAYRIEDIINALTRQCQIHKLDTASTYIWICCLCVVMSQP